MTQTQRRNVKTNRVVCGITATFYSLIEANKVAIIEREKDSDLMEWYAKSN
jgi:hypothetical protein